MPRKTRLIVSDTFESRTTATLEAQDRILERVEKKLESPVLNGGFDNLMTKVEKIESIQSQMGKVQETQGEKIDSIHSAIYEPEKGLYVKVKDANLWISRVDKASKWFIGLLVAGILTGVGKVLYDFLSGHIHYAP